MMYIVKGPQFMHKRHLSQLRRRISNEANSGPSEETVMYVIYDTFNIPPPPLAAFKRNYIQSETEKILKRKIIQTVNR